MALVLAGIGLVLAFASAIGVETGRELSLPGGVATFIGSITGLVGTYLALLMVLIVSRIPAIEHVLGQDGLVRWHKWLAPWPLSLIGLHAVFITVGYAEAAKKGIWHELGTMVTGYPDMLAATVGLGLMALAGITSIRAIRSRLRRETWWVIHLYLYLAIALSFAHVLVLGPSFVGQPVARAVWVLAWLATAGSVIWFRFGLPVVRSLRYRLVVKEVKTEAPGVVSVVCTGRRLDQLAISGGQFFEWRFLTRHLWWQAHPYSVSALPRPPYLRLTVKVVGDHSAAVARLRRGTRIMVEGPYGAFTRHAQRRRTAVLIAGGIGVTALRALLEDLPSKSAPEVVVRVTNPEDFVFRSEVTELARRLRGRVHEVAGNRKRARLDPASLRGMVPDIARRDVFVCGSEGFVHEVVAAVHALGVDPQAIHYEVFGF
ncbi:MAG: ferredoxin reductase family protein [Acidimicrobiales bacterium]